MKRGYQVRLSLIFLFFLSFYAIILANLYVIQLLKSDFFEELGKQQYTMTVTQKPPRAEIYDRTDEPLALNTDSIAAFCVPNNLKKPAETKKFLKKYFNQAYERLIKNPRAQFLYIKRRLTPQEIALIKQNKLEDIYFLKEPSRFYPVDSLGPVIGITDIDNEGLFGIELLYNTTLAGNPTTYFLEKDARSGNFYFKKETKVAGNTGTPVTLTLDATLNFLAYEELKGTIKEFCSEEGSIIIMNPVTGEILAMANYPDFDPHQTESLDLATTKNKILTEVYEFGSVMKVFPALAALEEQVVTPDELIDCENQKIGFIDGIKISTWKAHDILPYTDVVAFSNNIGTSKVAKRLGSKVYDHYLRCGFGKLTGLGFPGEQKGFINPPKLWSKQSPFSLSFGYEINATLLQLACAYCMIANWGQPIKPVLVKHNLEKPQKKLAQPLYSHNTMEIMHNILTKTITEGTARRAKINNVIVKGKTGTANLLENGIYNPDHNIFTFAGIIEKDDYKRVIVTFIKGSTRKNIYSSTVAVPLFERVAQKMLIHEKII